MTTDTNRLIDELDRSWKYVTKEEFNALLEFVEFEESGEFRLYRRILYRAVEYFVYHKATEGIINSPIPYSGGYLPFDDGTCYSISTKGGSIPIEVIGEANLWFSKMDSYEAPTKMLANGWPYFTWEFAFTDTQCRKLTSEQLDELVLHSKAIEFMRED